MAAAVRQAKVFESSRLWNRLALAPLSMSYLPVTASAKDERRQRLSPVALAAVDRKVQSAQVLLPIVIAGVLRLIDFVLISFIGVGALFWVWDRRSRRFVALSHSGFKHRRRHSGDLASCRWHLSGTALSGRLSAHPAIAALLVRSLHTRGRPVSRRTTRRCFVASMVCRILLCRNCCAHFRTTCGARRGVG